MSDTHTARPSAQPMISLRGVTKTYGSSDAVAVEPLDLDIEMGEFVCLVGPSGCGKTTTLRMINRLVEPTGGRIFIDGADVTESDPDRLRRGIGYVIQQIGLIPHMTIRQNIAIVPKLLQWPTKKIDERVDQLLDLVGLDPATFASRYPKQLSGGQQQRVGVARSLAADPPILLMDEPFGAIDPINRTKLQSEFLQLQQRIRKTIVFVTHDIDEALKLADRVAIFSERGRIAQLATPLEILSHPANEFVRTFIGEGARLRRLRFLRLGDLTFPETVTRCDGDLAHRAVLDPDMSVFDALEQLLHSPALGAALPDGRHINSHDLLAAASAADAPVGQRS